MKKLFKTFLFGVFFAGRIFAKEVNVYVFDADLEIPLEGVRLTVKSKKSLSVFTDEQGRAVINADEKSADAVEASLPGYKKESVSINPDSSEIEIKMTIADVIEGKELVVNRVKAEEIQEKPGVSTVMTKEKMHSTASMGIIEDCMASVRTLPGVSFSGAWGSEPSVRGGDPRELAVTLDGMYTIFPWHWGGGNSILNPAMIESVKLSNGIFSARYGKASSGLLEATTLKPDFEKSHVNASISTMSADVFAQAPLGKDLGGLLFGTHLTYLEPIFAMYDACGNGSLASMKRPPYIRDFFFKANLKPTSVFDISLIGFYGSDGLTYDDSETEKGLTTKQKMDYDIYQGIAGLNVKYLPTDNLQFHGLLSYNGMSENLDMKTNSSGTIKYTDEFMNKYSALPGVASGSYNLNGIDEHYKETVKSHLVNGKLESEIELNEKNHLCVGVEEIVSFTDTSDKMNLWRDIEFRNNWLFKKSAWNTETKGNRIFNSAGFTSWTYGNENSLINSEIGVRGEFVTIYNSKENYTLNMVPQICPRASVNFTPWRQTGKIKSAGFSAGTGLFVSNPRETMMLSKEYGAKNYDLKPNTALFAVLGGNMETENDWKFKLEIYYKHYLSRLYLYTTSDAAEDFSRDEMHAKTDGKGHVFGVDAMIEKNVGDSWDGYLSYSFVNARFKNPAGIRDDQYVSQKTGELDQWFYPDYHRFHTINVVSNWHFGEGWTFTVKGTLATGAPKEKTGPLTCYAAVMEDGTVVQRYTKSTIYSDTLRNQISCPVDVRISKQWQTHNGKANWEFYFAVQDLFVNFYSPKGEKSFNEFTGEMSDIEESPDFSIGVPLPSIGIKLRF